MLRSRMTPGLLVLILATFGLDASAEPTTPPPDRIEEDWELVIISPDLVGVGPQITTAMSPTGDLVGTPFVAFNLNYREYPYFRAGGLQVQAWSGKSLLAISSHETAQLSTPGETIAWTQRMAVVPNGVEFAICAGDSTTWGKFGQGGQLTTSFNSAVTNLGSYSPAVSAANSGAGWESNLVTSMTLKRVRYYQNGQILATDETPRVIDLDQ